MCEGEAGRTKYMAQKVSEIRNTSQRRKREPKLETDMASHLLYFADYHRNAGNDVLLVAGVGKAGTEDSPGVDSDDGA